VLTGLEWLKEKNLQGFLLTVPSDAPLFPLDLKEQLTSAIASGTKVVVASHKNRYHPTFALWHTSLVDSLRDGLINHNVRKVMDFVESQQFSKAVFEDPRQFMNLNTPKDFKDAEQLMADYQD